MSLRLKLTTILAALVLIFAAVDWTIQRAVIDPSFEDLEQGHAEENLQPVSAALQDEVQHLEALVHDWARDESCRFSREDDAACVQASMTPAMLADDDPCSFPACDDGTSAGRSRPDQLDTAQFSAFQRSAGRDGAPSDEVVPVQGNASRETSSPQFPAGP
jgi:hypothetical protein